MWPDSKSCFRKYWKGSEILAKTLCVKSWFRFSTMLYLFLCRFLILNKFLIFFQWEESLQIRKKYYADNIKCTQCWEFKAIKDARSRNGPKWQKMYNCATFYQIICYIGARIKNDLYSLQSENIFFGKRYTE